MAINQNHLFEELDGVKCAVVEKNVVPSRVTFLRGLLEANGYTVVVVGSPPPKAAASAAGAPLSASAPSAAPAPAAPAVAPASAVPASVAAPAVAPASAVPAYVAAVPAPRPTTAASGAPVPASITPAGSAPPAPQPSPAPAPLLPETFTVGVTDVTFNATNAVFGRLLRTKDGHVVTLAYWQQKDAVSHDEVPYFEGSGAC